MYKQLFLLAVLFVLQSCGFHLRGSIELPPEIVPLYMERFGVDNELSRELRNQLSQAAAGSLAESKDLAAAELTINSARAKKRVTAVDERGRVRQYELSYDVKYTVAGQGIRNEGNTETRELRLKRDLLFDPESVLAIGHEQAMLYEDMRKDAARMILQQLAAMGQRPAEE